MKRGIAKDPQEAPQRMRRLLLLSVCLLLLAGCRDGSEKAPPETAAEKSSAVVTESVLTDTETTAPRYGELHTP